MAKLYLAITFFIGGISIFLAFAVGKFSSAGIEFLSIYSLIIFYSGIVFMLLSFISLYNSNELTWRSMLWIFGPVLGLIVLHGIGALVWGSPRVYSFAEYRTVIPTSPLLMLRTLILVAVVFGVVAVAFKYFQARKAYNDMLNDYFSGEEVRRSLWIDRFFKFVLVNLVFVIGSIVITSVYFDLLYGAVLTVGMVYLVIKVINYQATFMHIVPAVEYAAEGGTAGKEVPDTVVGMLLQQWMWREDKPFLKGGLALSDVSHMTGLGRRKLSAHINIKYGMTFNSWINMLRIQEVERILKNKGNSERTLSEIAYMTGFADLAAMSNAFKKVTGVSPSVYRRSCAE